MDNNFCRLTAIFEKQQALMDKYGPLEEASGLLPAPLKPVDLHDSRGQALLRDFAWRLTEELTEATADLEEKGKMEESFFMELIDALHFMVEICILSRIDPPMVSKILASGKDQDVLDQLYKSALGVSTLTPDLFDASSLKTFSGYGVPGLLGIVGKASYQVIHELGKAIGCLKNKPHKQTYISTDTTRFRLCIVESFISLVSLFALVGLSPQQVYEAYVLKQKINHKRIDSNY